MRPCQGRETGATPVTRSKKVPRNLGDFYFFMLCLAAGSKGLQVQSGANIIFRSLIFVLRCAIIILDNQEP